MRTTIRLDDALLRRAKSAAAMRGISLNELIADAVRAALAPKPGPGRVSEPSVVPLPTFAGRGLRPGVDLDNSAALADLMDDLE